MHGIRQEDVSSLHVLLVLLTLFAVVAAVQGYLDKNALREGLYRKTPSGIGPMVNIRNVLLFLIGFNVIVVVEKHQIPLIQNEKKITHCVQKKTEEQW